MKRVITYGTFDLLHYGHINLLKRARALGDYLELFISGPKGSTKSETIGKVITELEENNLVFQQFCFENTVIDDFLLNFYDALRDFSLAQKISLKKFAQGTFKEKVSHYFKTIDVNCIIIVENFEKVEDDVEIINFLSHLATYTNVKIIFFARKLLGNITFFKAEALENKMGVAIFMSRGICTAVFQTKFPQAE